MFATAQCFPIAIFSLCAFYIFKRICLIFHPHPFTFTFQDTSVYGGRFCYPTTLVDSATIAMTVTPLPAVVLMLALVRAVTTVAALAQGGATREQCHRYGMRYYRNHQQGRV
jgi:hypothetical protein